MPYYNFLVVSENQTLSTPARDRNEALAIFGKELGVCLTLDDQGIVALYMLGESHKNVHWIKPTIPVYWLSTTVRVS
jgi:hypothetical protein